MTHLPFIVASYAIFLTGAIGLSVDAALRLGRARARLHVLDTRAGAARDT